MPAQLYPAINALQLVIDPPTEGGQIRDDLDRVKVWYNLDGPDFNPGFGQGVLTYNGDATLNITIPNLNPLKTYYIKYALFSSIDDSEYTLSQTYTATPLGGAISVQLTTSAQIFNYSAFGTNPVPSSTTLTAVTKNLTGPVFYQFLIAGQEVSRTTNSTYLYYPENTYEGMPEQVVVKIRSTFTGWETAVLDNTTVIAEDSISLIGIKPGENGADGTSVSILGSVGTATALPGYPDQYQGNSGDAYIVQNTGHLWIWDDTVWIDAGNIQGPQGNPGINTATVTVYAKGTDNTSPPTPAISGQFSYNFSNSQLTAGSLGVWSTTPPSITKGEYLWARYAVASSNSGTDTIDAGDFSPAIIISIGGIDGTSPLIYNIVTSAPVITKEAASAATSGAHSSITIQGKKYDGSTTTNYGWVTVTANGDTEATTATDTASSAVSLAPANGDGKTSYTIKLYNQAAVSGATLLDTQVINVLFKGATGTAGANAITAILSNESHVFPANKDGAVSSYTSSGTEIRVYEGTTELVYDGVGTANSSWKITTAATNITVGSITDSGTYATVAQHSAVADATDTSSITYTIAGKTASGSAFTIVKTQTFAKSKTGATGANAIIYDIVTSAPVITKEAADATTSGAHSSITIQGKKYDGSTTTNYGWVTVTANEATEAATATDTASSAVSLAPANGDGKTSYTIKLYNQATVSGATLLDTQVINVLFKGATGTAGINTATVSLYKKSSDGTNAPAAFTGTFTYTFSTQQVSTTGDLNGWSTTAPSIGTGEYLWVRSAVAASSSATTTLSFNAATVAGSGGPQGNPGINASWTKYVYVYKLVARANNSTASVAPAAPSGGVFSVDNLQLTTAPDGWSLAQPGSATGTVYVSRNRVAPNNQLTGNITLSSAWSTPVAATQVLENGGTWTYDTETHQSVYTQNIQVASIYTKTSNTGTFPSTPTGGTFIITGPSQNNITPPSGWYNYITNLDAADSSTGPIFESIVTLATDRDILTYTPTWNTPQFYFRSAGQLGATNPTRSSTATIYLSSSMAAYATTTGLGTDGGGVAIGGPQNRVVYTANYQALSGSANYTAINLPAISSNAHIVRGLSVGNSYLAAATEEATQFGQVSGRLFFSQITNGIPSSSWTELSMFSVTTSIPTGYIISYVRALTCKFLGTGRGWLAAGSITYSFGTSEPVLWKCTSDNPTNIANWSQVELKLDPTLFRSIVAGYATVTFTPTTAGTSNTATMVVNSLTTGNILPGNTVTIVSGGTSYTGTVALSTTTGYTVAIANNAAITWPSGSNAYNFYSAASVISAIQEPQDTTGADNSAIMIFGDNGLIMGTTDLTGATGGWYSAFVNWPSDTAIYNGILSSTSIFSSTNLRMATSSGYVNNNYIGFTGGNSFTASAYINTIGLKPNLYVSYHQNTNQSSFGIYVGYGITYAKKVNLALVSTSIGLFAFTPNNPTSSGLFTADTLKQINSNATRNVFVNQNNLIVGQISTASSSSHTATYIGYPTAAETFSMYGRYNQQLGDIAQFTINNTGTGGVGSFTPLNFSLAIRCTTAGTPPSITLGSVGYTAGTSIWERVSNLIDGDLIVAGSITADSLAVNSVTAKSVVAESITAGKIAANAITADKINAGAITATKIAAGAITADKINVSQLSAVSANLGSITGGSLALGGVAVSQASTDLGTIANTAFFSNSNFLYSTKYNAATGSSLDGAYIKSSGGTIATIISSSLGAFGLGTITAINGNVYTVTPSAGVYSSISLQYWNNITNFPVRISPFGIDQQRNVTSCVYNSGTNTLTITTDTAFTGGFVQNSSINFLNVPTYRVTLTVGLFNLGESLTLLPIFTNGGALLNNDGTFIFGKGTSSISFDGTNLNVIGNIVTTGNIVANAITSSQNVSGIVSYGSGVPGRIPIIYDTSFGTVKVSLVGTFGGAYISWSSFRIYRVTTDPGAALGNYHIGSNIIYSTVGQSSGGINPTVPITISFTDTLSSGSGTYYYFLEVYDTYLGTWLDDSRTIDYNLTATLYKR